MYLFLVFLFCAVSAAIVTSNEESKNAKTYPHCLFSTSRAFQDRCWVGDVDRQTGHSWTYEPFCITTETKESEVCVYTDVTFANGRGISIIAQPSMARQLAGHPMLQTPGLQVQSSSSQARKLDRYEFRSLPGRGIGVIANETLQRGSLLMFETPLVAFHRDAMTLPDSLMDLFSLHRIAIERLPSVSRDLYMSLDDGGIGMDPHGDRFETNAFNVLDYVLVFPNIARLNHDCRPNVEYYFDRNSFSKHIHTTRTIEAGEEITASYISHDIPFKQRSHRLQSQWGFTCTCSLCTASPTVREESDTRLARIHELEKNLADISSYRNVSVVSAEELISLYEAERIHGPIAKAYEFAALEYSYVGRLDMVRWFASLAIDMGRLWKGPDYAGVKRMEVLLGDVEGHASWRKFL